MEITWYGHSCFRITERGLTPGEFLARVEGQGLVPTGGIGLQLHDGEHWVRGEFEE